MSFLVLILAVLVFAALCALVGYVLVRPSQTDGSPLSEELEKLSVGPRRTRALIGGIMFFFPAFFLSLPLTVAWARHHWPGDGQAAFRAFWPSVGMAMIAAICRCIYLLMKVNVDSSRDKNFG